MKPYSFRLLGLLLHGPTGLNVELWMLEDVPECFDKGLRLATVNIAMIHNKVAIHDPPDFNLSILNYRLIMNSIGRNQERAVHEASEWCRGILEA